ncbi:CoA transferase [Dactylosporangium roseum]|uniref:CoA transferase n=1 Tax=Dactylosporangium roseum TaxID=47989 RepID=A0ABY5YXD9_9ACTN|nr:CoA transferase [Dactylosporangium roseum]UWZ34421.1 CoA transferase [Dactylosporangium roseum]
MSADDTAPLRGLVVVEWGSDHSLAYAGWLLRLLGADVVKIEPPDGDPRRTAPPLAPTGTSAMFEFLDGGKRSARVDATDRAAITRLIERADLVLEAMGPGRVEALGLGDLLTRPGIRFVRVSPFGQDGPHAPHPATPFTLQAASGWLQRRGNSARPIQVGGRYPLAFQAVHTALAGLIALAIPTTAPVVADLSLQECLQTSTPLPTRLLDLLRQLGREEQLERRPLGVVRCRDGWAGINILTAQQWADVCVLLGVEEFVDGWAVLRRDPARLAEFSRRTRDVLAGMAVDDVVSLCQALRVPANPIGDGGTLPGLAHWREREFFVTRERDGVTWRHPSAPWRFSRSPLAPPRNAPDLGEYQPTPGAPWPTPGWGSVAAPLSRLRILDLTTFWAGPSMTCVLGGYGADVIKVESIQRPDGQRYGLTFRELGDDWYEHSGLWQGTNLNKRSLTLDLTREPGRDLVRRLVARADVLVENYSVRVLDSFGLGWDEVRALNPRAVLVRLPGFGLTGPWRDYVGWGMTFEQLCGPAWQTGEPDGPPVTPGGYCDALVGMHGAVATLAALVERDRSGIGQLVEVPQIEVVACATADQMVTATLTGAAPGRVGNDSPDALLQDVFPLAGPDEWLALSVQTAAQLAALRTVVGDRDGPVREAVAAWAEARKPDETVPALLAAGIPAARVETPATIREHPQLVARGYWTTVARRRTGSAVFPTFPVRFTPGPPNAHRRPAPTLGQHNEEILRDELGLDDAAIAALAADQIIGTTPLGA